MVTTLVTVFLFPYLSVTMALTSTMPSSLAVNTPLLSMAAREVALPLRSVTFQLVLCTLAPVGFRVRTICRVSPARIAWVAGRAALVRGILNS